MRKHEVFLKWWLLVVLMSVGFYFVYAYGLFNELWNKDFTKITLIILGGFLLTSLQCGIKTFRLSSSINKKQWENVAEIEKELSIGYFACAIFVSLGLLGTLIGMVYSLQGFATIDVSNLTTIQGLIPKLTMGVSTALYTTIVGVI